MVMQQGHWRMSTSELTRAVGVYSRSRREGLPCPCTMQHKAQAGRSITNIAALGAHQLACLAQAALAGAGTTLSRGAEQYRRLEWEGAAKRERQVW
jgi:hypothetical protein